MFLYSKGISLDRIVIYKKSLISHSKKIGGGGFGPHGPEVLSSR